MRSSLFGPLKDTIEAMPAGAIMTTLELVSRMLKEDLAYDRPLSVREVESFLSFCDFLKAVKDRSPVQVCANSSSLHYLGLYKKIIERLVTAKELPAEALVQFESSFFKIHTGPLPGGVARQNLWPDF
jgi:hypothetical protein